jgi:hypothetical protein
MLRASRMRLWMAVAAVAALRSTCAEADSGREETPLAKVLFGAPVEPSRRESLVGFRAAHASGTPRPDTTLSRAGDRPISSAFGHFMRVLVIGGTGSFSTRVTQKALERGHDVLVYARGRWPLLDGLAVRWLHADRAALRAQEGELARFAPDVVVARRAAAAR